MTSTTRTDMAGKVVAITGANTGIGFATAKALARRGATILACGRSAAKLDAAAAALRVESNGGRVQTFVADLASIEGTRGLATSIAEHTDRLDVLINNAGLAVDRRIETDDGLELTFAVNVLAPFVLTNELLPLLKASAPARVITVSSAMHSSVKNFDLDDLQSTNGYAWSKVYNRAKLGSLLFSNELARRLDGTGVTSNALHPGLASTDFGADGDFTGAFALLYRIVNRFLPSADAAAQTPIHLATAPNLEGVSGRYFVKGEEESPSEVAQDEALAKDLWMQLERLAARRVVADMDHNGSSAAPPSRSTPSD